MIVARCHPTSPFDSLCQKPQICHGRNQLACWTGRDAGRIMRAELDKMISHAGRILAVTNSHGIDAIRARKAATSMWARCAINASQHVVPVGAGTRRPVSQAQRSGRLARHRPTHEHHRQFSVRTRLVPTSE